MVDLLFVIVGVFLWSVFVFGAGYLFAAREFGKEVKFYQDCVRTLRQQIINADEELRK